MIVESFNARKAAQVVAFFARESGGRINVLKLIKLVYLADRESMRNFDRPILFDQIVSMDHGPVNSATYDLVNGASDVSSDWDSFVGPRAGHDVTLARENIANEDLDELSRRDLKVLEAVWRRFKDYGKYQIRDWTHENCPEWENPQGSSAPIPYDRIFKFLGKKNAEQLSDFILESQNLRENFRRCAHAVDTKMDAV
jgi:uncharacterized phage-associated protein